MNQNKEYWIKRYKDKGGIRTVGRSNWTQEDYDKFMIKVTPIVKEIIIKECKLTSILDFGCGIGRWIPLLDELFEEYYGVDLIEQAVNECRDNFNNNILLLTDSKIPLEENIVDNIWTYVTLQHVIDLELLENYIQQFYKLLKPDGVCVITENSCGNRTNNYMSFRPPKIYMDMFTNNGFEFINRYDKINQHTTLVFRKN